MLPFLRILYWRLFRIFLGPLSLFRSQKKILLVCNWVLMVDYLKLILEILSDDNRLGFCVILPDKEERPGAFAHIRRKLPIKQVNRWVAYGIKWDLIIAVDHTMRNLVDCRFCPTIYISHGIETGKRVRGEPYTFGKMALSHSGRVRYSRLCTSSYSNQARGLKQNPILHGTVAVTGILRFDKVLTLTDQRETIRKTLGFQPNETVVLIVSTHGPHCLFRTMGDAVLHQARELQGEFRFLFLLHPAEHYPKTDGKRDWEQYRQEQCQHGINFLAPNEEFEPNLVACDIVLTDQTSLAFYAAMLSKPLVFVPIPEDALDKDGLMWRLMEMSLVTKEDASDLRDCLLTAMHCSPSDTLKDLCKDINSYPGKARYRVRKEIYSLLGISPK
jgi:hypothetical protein